MQKRSWLPIKIISLLIVFLVFPRTASAYYTNMPASIVIGQPDFTSNSANQGGSPGANTLANPYDAILVGKKLIVSDYSNHRVLIYNSIPTTNNAAADVVIGQPDFVSKSTNQGIGVGANTLYGPDGLISDGTRLVIADAANNRVLIYNSIPTTNNAAADVVIGQPDFVSRLVNQGGSPTEKTLSTPSDVFVDNGRLFIVDPGNHRILIYNSIPTTNNAAADVVIGQPDFTSNAGNQGGTPAANTLWYPGGVLVNEGKLFIAETKTGAENGNKRILIYNSIPTTNNAAADVVIGQPDFTSNAGNQGGTPDKHTLYSTRHPWVFNGQLFIPEDFGNNRVLIYNSIPTTNNAAADVVIGQPDFKSTQANQGGSPLANTVNRPTGGFATDTALGIVDRINSRILLYENYESISSLGFTISFPPESSADKMRLSGNIVMGEYGKFDLRSPEVSINNQGFGSLTNFSKRQHSDHETISEFYHEFEPWAGVAPRDQWTEGDGFTAHFKATSYQSRIETQEAFLFWPFTLDSVNTESATPVFSFHIPSKNVEHIKNNLDRFEVYIGKEGSFNKYLKRVPVNLVGEDGRVIVSANSEGVLTAQSTFLPGEYEVTVRAVDKWGNHFDSNAMPLTLTQTLVSVESTPLFSGFWFPLQINRATGINTGIISSFRSESMRASYTTTTLTPTFAGIAFADSLITMTVVNNQNAGDTKTFTTTTGADSTFSLTPTLYPDSTVSITAQKAGLSAQLRPFQVQLAKSSR